MAEQYVVIAEGAGTDFSLAEAAEAQLQDGTPIEFRLWVNNAVDSQQLAGIQSNLLSQGIPTEVAYDSGIIVIRLTKTPSPAPAAVTQGVGRTGRIGQAERIGQWQFIVAGVGLIGVVVFAWQLASKVGTSLSNPLLIFGVLAIIVVYFTFTRRRGQQQPAQQEEQQYG